MQSKLESLKESFSQSFIGIFIGLITIRTMLPLVESLDKNTQSIVIVLVMFILSTSRSFIVRRYFNKKDTKSNTK